MINQVRAKLNNIIMKIICLESLKQIYSAEATCVKLIGLANIVTIIYGLGLLQVAVKIIFFHVLSEMSNFQIKV